MGKIFPTVKLSFKLGETNQPDEWKNLTDRRTNTSDVSAMISPTALLFSDKGTAPPPEKRDQPLAASADQLLVRCWLSTMPVRQKTVVRPASVEQATVYTYQLSVGSC